MRELEQFERDFPNDADFGAEIRKIMGNNDFARKYPNDMDLGELVRKIIRSK